MLKHFEEITSNESKKPPQRHSREAIYAERIALLKDAPHEIHIPLQAIHIGDLGIAAIPFETFTETGLELKDRSPFGQTFTIELANGSYGYLPTPEQHRLGGYEWLGTNYVEEEASTKIVATLLDLFQTLKQNGAKTNDLSLELRQLTAASDERSVSQSLSDVCLVGVCKPPYSFRQRQYI